MRADQRGNRRTRQTQAVQILSVEQQAICTNGASKHSPQKFATRYWIRRKERRRGRSGGSVKPRTIAHTGHSPFDWAMVTVRPASLYSANSLTERSLHELTRANTLTGWTFLELTLTDGTSSPDHTLWPWVSHLHFVLFDFSGHHTNGLHFHTGQTVVPPSSRRRTKNTKEQREMVQRVFR